MPGGVEPVADERGGLLGYLAHQRLVLRIAAYGLTDDQARATPTPSTLGVGGLIKHGGFVEREWMDNVRQRESPSGRDAYEEHFRLLPGEALESVIEVYGQAGAETARHAGHADTIREAVDGASAFPLMPAAEGWPATDWLQPGRAPRS